MRAAPDHATTLPETAEALRALLLAAWAERDSAVAERDALAAERDALAAQNDRCHTALNRENACRALSDVYALHLT